MNAILKQSEHVFITAPGFGILKVILKGSAPLVIERFSKKAEGPSETQVRALSCINGHFFD